MNKLLKNLIHHTGDTMTNILQFYSKEYKQCEKLIREYENLGELLLKSSGMFFDNINKEMNIMFAQLEDLVGEINHEKQRVSIAKRLLNINMNIHNELDSRKSYVIY